MTTRLTTEIRPTHMPPYCSACHGQDPKLKYWDMDAACDRGYGEGPAVRVSFDDLILCEDCASELARAMGWMPKGEYENELGRLEDLHNFAKKRVKQLEEYTDRMEDALNHRPGGKILDHRQKPRNLREVSSDR
jgi:hypothetical protein